MWLWEARKWQQKCFQSLTFWFKNPKLNLPADICKGSVVYKHTQTLSTHAHTKTLRASRNTHTHGRCKMKPDANPIDWKLNCRDLSLQRTNRYQLAKSGIPIQELRDIFSTSVLVSLLKFYVQGLARFIISLLNFSYYLEKAGKDNWCWVAF